MGVNKSLGYFMVVEVTLQCDVIRLCSFRRKEPQICMFCLQILRSATDDCNGMGKGMNFAYIYTTLKLAYKIK